MPHSSHLTLVLTISAQIIFSSLLAQDAKLKWGNVQKTDLHLKECSWDTTATSLVLAHKGSIRVSIVGDRWRVAISEHKRIKIFSESAYDQGDISIPYHKDDQISGVQAQVILPNDDVIKLSKKEIFDEKLSDSWSQKKFAIPALEPGAIIEYKYNKITDDLLTLKDWYFQEDIPVRYSELTVMMPKYFEYLFLGQGPIKHDILQEKAEAGTLMVPHLFTATNLKGLKAEPYITAMDNYLCKIQFQLNKIHYPNRPIENILNGWGVLARELMDSEYFGKQITRKNQSADLVAAADGIVSDDMSAVEKAMALYRWVQTTIEWDGVYTRSARESLDKVFARKKGSSGELNLMLIALLNSENIDALPVLISTRSNGRTVSQYPIISQFDHMIVRMEEGGKIHFLDLGSDFKPTLIPNQQSLNYEGLIIYPDTSNWTEIIPEQGSDQVIVKIELYEDGSFTGELRGKYLGYNSIAERSHYSQDSEGTHWKERIGENFLSIEIDSVATENLEVWDDPFKDHVFFSGEGFGLDNGDLMYFPTALYSSFKEPLFKLEERDYPVEISYPISEQIVFQLSLPDGYALSETPEQERVILPNGSGQYDVIYSEGGGRIIVNHKLKLNGLKYEPDQYPILKEFFDRVSEKMGEQLVIEKNAK